MRQVALKSLEFNYHLAVFFTADLSAALLKAELLLFSSAAAWLGGTKVTGIYLVTSIN